MRNPTWIVRPIAVAVSCCFATSPAWANPTGAQIVGGVVSMQHPDAHTLNVTNSPGSIINWQGFSIGAGEATRFIQQSSSSAVLNRVVGADISQISGQLLSNGRVFLINPAGIVIGGGAIVDTAGFVGSTLNMLDSDFLAGKLTFQGDAKSGSIINQGWIKSSSGGNVILVAPQIENSGVIQTEGGQIILAAGQKLTIGSLDYEGVQFEVQAPTDSVVNIGKLLADGGAVGVFAGTLRHTGDIRANALTSDGAGHIVLSAQKDVTAESGSTIAATGANGGSVTVRAGETAQLAGTIDATANTGHGGIIQILGKLVNLMTGASANASGKTAGGSIHVTAPVIIQAGDIHADGASGGSVNVQATHLLQAGAASADGSAGSGGSVSVSADNIIQTASTLLSANGNGGAGGSVTVAAGQKTGDGVFSSATLSATGSASGGRIAVTGNEIVMRAAQLDASGNTGGGTALVGGDWQGKNPDVPNAQHTQVNFSTGIKADAKEAGNGGKVVVWSDQATQFSGAISARGGAQSGDGGRIEVSGKENLIFGGIADAGASHGTPGLLLLDPKAIVIDAAATGGASAIDLVDPNIAANDRFGTNTAILGNGNVIALEPSDSFIASNAGAVHLFNGTNGALLSSLTGSQANDGVGSGGVTTLVGNSNFVVSSPNWNNGAATRAGAATFRSGTSGVSEAVSAANSLVGTTTNDQVASGQFGGGTAGATALTSGNYVVLSPAWNSGAATRAGAVTFGSGTSGVVGAVSAANSLVGDAVDDIVGRRGLTALPNGNYVVFSDIWHSFGGGTGGLGAVTFGSGTSGISGVVSAANSLVGSTQNDQVGFDTAVVLGNNNYVVVSSIWNNGAATRAGAVTFVNGANGNVFNTGSPGAVVGAANSLIGSSASDFVGRDGVVTLRNNNYVVVSTQWRNGAAAQAGAVTFGSGTSGVAGAVSAANSLVGSTANDDVGFGGVTTLANGNYVVTSPFWNNGTATRAGAVTFGSGTSGVTGAVSVTNSLVGSTANDTVGDIGGGGNGVVALNNGNYVVASPFWNGVVSQGGAVTFGNGTSGVAGLVSVANSLVGSTANDQVGLFGVIALTNGNYAVNSPFWNGAASQTGAVTFGNGTSGVSGAVSAANSLVGFTASDFVGFGGVTALTNGNYVVTSAQWNNGAATQAGAVTFGNGTSGISGAVSAANSLVGSTANDAIGSGGITALSNGNYVVNSNLWNNGAATQAGAVTFGSGTSGVVGAVSATNSLVGSTASDFVGDTVTALTNGNYVVRSLFWHNGAASNAGAMTFGSGTAGIVGAVSTANSLVGSTTNDNVGSGGVTQLTNGNYVVTSPGWSNGAATQAGAVTFGNGATGVAGAVGASNSLVGASANDSVGSGGITAISGNRVLVSSPAYDNASLTDSGRLQIYDGSATGGPFTNPLLFADSAAAGVTISTAAITAITNAGTSLVLQANNDITLNASSNITTSAAGAGGSVTMQAGRSIVLNSNITTDNGNVTLTANETTANGVIAANRDAGAAAITMAPGTTINAGTGNIFVRMNPGTGQTGTSGNITLANLSAANVSVFHDGPTANGSIVRAAGASLITVPNGGTVHMEIENTTAGPTSSIGTSAAPIQITAGAGNTAILESHYHDAQGGIYIDALSNLQIGGANAAIFNGGVKGVQALTKGGGSAGPVQLTSTGTIVQKPTTTPSALCGFGASTQDGGPVCSGRTDAGGAFLAASDSVLLRANDMALNRPVTGTSVVFVPNAGGAITVGGAGGGLSLDQSEFDQITAATSLQIGEGGSGNMTFVGNIITPGTTPVTFLTGGSMTTTQGAGTTDITARTTTSNITLNASGGIGATGAGRIKLDTSVGSAARFTSIGTGTVFTEQTRGDITILKWVADTRGQNIFEIATTDGNILMTSGGTSGSGTWTYATGGTNKDIIFSGVPAGPYDAASMTFAPTANGGATRFTSDTQTFNTAVATARPLLFTGGSAIFNNSVTATTSNGSLAINAGTATFNGTSTFAGPMTVSGGTLDGAGAVAANGGLAFTGGTISSIGGVTVPQAGGNLDVSGTPTLGGTLNSDTLNMTGGTFTISAGGLLNLTGNGARSISGGSFINAGTVNLNAGSLNISGTPTLTNATGGTFNIGTGADVAAINANGTQLFTNNGTLNSAGTHGIFAGGTSARFDNAGAVNVTSGTLSLPEDVDVSGPLGDTGSYNVSGGATVRFPDAFRDFLAESSISGAGDVRFESGSGGVYNISGTYNPGGITSIAGNTTVNFRSTANVAGLSMTGGTLNVAGTGVLNLTGTGAKTVTGGVLTNTGMIHLQGGTLQANSAFPTNAGTLNVDTGTTLSTTTALTNASTGVIMGTGTIDLVGNTLTNNGTVAPGASPGTLTILGNYVQGSTGILNIELGGTTQGVTYDLLDVSGNATLGGTLNVTYFGAFSPSGGNTFDFMTYGSRTGDFATFNYPPGASFQPQLNPTFDRLAFVGSTSGGGSSSSSSGTMSDSTNEILTDEDRLREALSNANVQPPELPRLTRQQCN